MTESTTIEAPPPPLEVTRILVEEDATPVVRLIGCTLRDAAAVARDGGDELVAGFLGTVAVRSHDTPQAATVTLAGDVVEVTSGVFLEPTASVVVDLNARFAPTEEPTGDAELAAALLGALRRPMAPWRDAAARFWAATREIPGIPDVLVVEATGPDGSERGRFGEGATTYGIAGPADLLSGVFSGADDFLVALAAGLQVDGTLSQLSVMTAASWRVRFDV
ncbi:hypothetical protein DJ010_11265 [Nocardioides silvaticus]|uniref:SCP2 domain-containing protein n=1 Tax=Nocardioides silvaticus TaxID=2201891 RepID=A0A316TEU7_9ACTN|nr:hypothetical protein [Nocardioides silvaticus]PWN02957.1 hypothetical protein DJ010_11265 [Nocardioides silvaticus]